MGKVKLFCKAHALPWDGNQAGLLRKKPNSSFWSLIICPYPQQIKETRGKEVVI